jgi:putative membrane protein
MKEAKMTYYNMMYGFGFNGIFMLIFWIAIIWLIVWTMQNIAKNKESAIGILEKRYAKSEITKKQYLEMKKTLK